MKTKTNKIETVVTKKRRTLDSILGINGLLTIAIIGSLFKDGIILPIASVCGLSSIYYLIKKRKELDKKQKYIGWGLVILWLVIIGVTNQLVSK